jgi:protocadherin Fat 4
MFENASISEAAEVGQELFTVKAIDEDLGLNSMVEYSITSGNTGSVFSVHAVSGRVMLASSLDYEQTNLYILTIQATDLGNPALYSSVHCWVSVIDENDHAPLFTSSPIVGYVTEDAGVSTSVLLVTAIDADSGANGNVFYTLKRQEPPGKAFEIDSQTGVISTTKSLDHEIAESYQLTIVASDQAHPTSARKSSEKTVTVNVHDLNDNSPEFVSLRSVPVLVGSPANTVVTTVKAVDKDSGMNGRVTYEIYNGDTDMFRINADTGDLFLKSSLSSQILAYDLAIKGRDNGPDRKSNIFQMSIFTRSSTDNGPTFSQTSYSGQMSENEPKGTSIVAVSASYPSGGGSIEYAITSITSAGVDQPAVFQVQPTSGLISTSQDLDREAGYDVFNLDVYAIDVSSSVPRTTKCTVSQ